MKKRIKYAIITIILLIIEVLIALFVHDLLVRPYLGDALVVILIYTFIRIFIPEKCPFLPLLIFLFAACVEVLQLFNIVNILGLENYKILKILIGSVFSIEDIFCYAVGCLILACYEYNNYKKYNIIK